MSLNAAIINVVTDDRYVSQFAISIVSQHVSLMDIKMRSIEKEKRVLISICEVSKIIFAIRRKHEKIRHASSGELWERSRESGSERAERKSWKTSGAEVVEKSKNIISIAE